MKWMEADLVYNNEKISIFGLELFYSKEQVQAILAGIDDKVRTVLSYHLHFDFVFMAGCFPGIACLCMMAAKRTGTKGIRVILVGFAFLQLVAWGFDITENLYLLKWLKNPVIGDEFGFYHLVVYSKWAIALLAVLVALAVLLITAVKRKI
jgi:hypothetical protein